MLHVIGTLNVGGVQRLVLGMAASPAGSAYRHSALCLFGASGDLKERFAEAGISVSSCGVPWPPKLDVGSYRLSRWLRQRLAWSFPYRFAREITRLGAELVHSHVTHRIDLQALGAIRRARLPMVWTVHGKYRPEGRELERWRRATRLVADAGAITVVAEDLARDFRQRGLDHPGGIAVTRGGIELSAFRSRPPRDPRWRSAGASAPSRSCSARAADWSPRRRTKSSCAPPAGSSGRAPTLISSSPEAAPSARSSRARSRPRGSKAGSTCRFRRERARFPSRAGRLRALLAIRRVSHRSRRGARRRPSRDRDACGGRAGDGRRRRRISSPRSPTRPSRTR